MTRPTINMIDREISIKRIGRLPYITKAEMMEFFQMSQATASRRIADLDKYSERGRYGTYAVLDGTGVTWINSLALVDLLKYKKKLDAGRHVPPYDAKEVAKEAVIYELMNMLNRKAPLDNSPPVQITKNTTSG